MQQMCFQVPTKPGTPIFDVNIHKSKWNERERGVFWVTYGPQFVFNSAFCCTIQGVALN